MQREILRFEPNKPVTVQLDKGPEGKQTQNQFGVTEFQYACNANAAIMWLPAQGRAALLRSGAQAGDTVQITKTLRGDAAVWDVRLIPDSVEPAPQQSSGMRIHANGQNYDFQPRNGSGNGYTNGAPKPQPAPTPRPAAPSGPTGKHLALCLCAAIDAVAEAQQYAHEKGLGITFLGSDIRAIANSIYINDQHNGGDRS